MKKILYFLLIYACSNGVVSCRKYLEVPPPNNQLTSDLVFKDSATATAAVLGIYSEMMASPAQFSSASTTFYAGMSADELVFYTAGLRDEFVANEISPSNHSLLATQFWSAPYKYIYTANLAIEKVEASSLSNTQKNTLIGECKFIRAFCYFYLVNLFGDVPLILKSDFRGNSTQPRSPVRLVYQQMEADLMDAQALLGTSYGTERIRPTRWAATALLARVYLYEKKWTSAASEATTLIGSPVFSLPSLSAVFQKTSPEAIWQLLPVNPTWNTWEGNAILPATGTSAPTYYLTPGLLNGFEANDGRKAAWTSTRTFNSQSITYPSKYRVYGNGAPLTEYYTVLRLAEQYLIRAEAKTQLDDLDGAMQDLNRIRSRAGLPPLTGLSKSALLTAIEQERRIELFAEWGHRWFDLKRTERANAVLGVAKPQTWQTTDVLWPIPQTEINANPSLTQNPGY